MEVIYAFIYIYIIYIYIRVWSAAWRGSFEQHRPRAVSRRWQLQWRSVAPNGRSSSDSSGSTPRIPSELVQGRIFRKSRLSHSKSVIWKYMEWVMPWYPWFPNVSICFLFVDFPEKPLHWSMRQRRTLKIASAPLRQRCQPRIVMRRHHSKGCPSIRLASGQSQAGDLCLLSNRTSFSPYGTYENSMWPFF